MSDWHWKKWLGTDARVVLELAEHLDNLRVETSLHPDEEDFKAELEAADAEVGRPALLRSESAVLNLGARQLQAAKTFIARRLP
jgi:hypothetical protein